jgi:hypothetical protein
MLGIGLGPNREHAKQPPDVVHRVGVIEAHATLDGVPDHMRKKVFVAHSHRQTRKEFVVSLSPSHDVEGRHVEKMGAEQSMVEVDAERPVLPSQRRASKRVARGLKAQATKCVHGGRKPLGLYQQVDIREVSMAPELGPPA